MKGIGSWYVGDVQIHGQLPPPLVWYGPPPALTPSAFGKDRVGHNVRSNRLPANADVLLHRLHSTLLQNIHQLWVLPHISRTELGLICLGYPIGCLNVKSFEPRESGPRDNPCLAAIEEDGLDNSLIKPRGYGRQRVLTPKDLTHTSPSSTGFPQLSPNCLNVIVILRHHLTEVLKDLDALKHIPVNRELLAKSQS
jgi:hypothetical protein